MRGLFELGMSKRELTIFVKTEYFKFEKDESGKEG